MNVSFDDRPFAVFDVSVTANLVRSAGQVDLVRRVHPRFQFHRAALVVERVEDHVHITRDGVDTARLPACGAVVTNGDEESAIVVLIEQLVRTILIAPFILHSWRKCFPDSTEFKTTNRQQSQW